MRSEAARTVHICHWDSMDWRYLDCTDYTENFADNKKEHNLERTYLDCIAVNMFAENTDRTRLYH